MLVVMLFFVLTNAASINLKKRQDFPPPSLIQGQKCTGISNDILCTTGICRVNGLDTSKCQLTDERPEGTRCLKDAACQGGLVCNDGLCQPNTTQTPTTTTRNYGYISIWSIE
ncbi:5967_t:CDS:2 [Gigaspora margarita]|uniref:5967_t:CDS:1 n=1 Tax=Gigaspora margarita TaxID=4874 RepID=A0ABN7UJ73_GIGMA|nr:5967_t:CDS:2 [Gigaspora margarita]